MLQVVYVVYGKDVGAGVMAAHGGEAQGMVWTTVVLPRGGGVSVSTAAHGGEAQGIVCTMVMPPRGGGVSLATGSPRPTLVAGCVTAVDSGRVLISVITKIEVGPS
jgi:hypothetical protein